MKSSTFGISRLALAFLMVASALLVSAPTASANVRVPGGNVPFYARIAAGEIYHTDEWAAIVFYRPPSCVRPDFNLLDFYDVPAAFGCGPLLTGGHEIWVNGPEVDPWPQMTLLHGLGAVPVWFVSWPALEQAVADGSLTIGELEGLQPRTGIASRFQELLRPVEDKIYTIEINANGTLDGGGSFRLHIQGVGEIYPTIHAVVHIVLND
jgi:hypothetical protein